MSLADSLGRSKKSIILSNAFNILVIAGLAFHDKIEERFFQSPAERQQSVSYTKFTQLASNNTIDHITVDGSTAIGSAHKGNTLQNTYKTSLPENADLQKVFEKSNADIEIVHSSIFDKLPYILIALMAWNMFSTTSVKKKIFREKDIKSEKSKVRFSDVAGIDEIQTEVQEIVSLLKKKKEDSGIKVKTPKGVLLVGGPGNGKTLLAKAIAGEADVPFFSAAATEFENMFYGSSAKQVRELFKKAKAEAPCIIFVDEIDAVARKRSNDGAASDSIVVEMLNQMDGFEELEDVIVLAATNKPEILDPALLRPGRFDKKIVVPQPTVKARFDILEVHTKEQPLADDVDLNSLAQMTYGFSGADLANLVNEAAIVAKRRPDAETITFDDFDRALDRIIMGIKRDLKTNEKEKRNTSIHEAGHALLMVLKNQPLHKVTNIPYGEALGVTVKRPDEEKYSRTLKELKDELVVLYGGRVAEELILGSENVSTGASNDIQVATDIARDMVTKYGFSPLGPIKIGNGSTGYLGNSFSDALDEHTSAKVYQQIEDLIKDAEKEARNLLEHHKTSLLEIVERLQEKETLSADEVKQCIKTAVQGSENTLKYTA